MSQNVEFILSLEDKQFTASIDRAGKLLTRFGEQATKPAQKINNLERSLGSVSRIIGVLESKLDATADKLQDVAAGFELVSDVSRKTRGNITSLNSGLKTLIERVDTTTSSVNKLTTSLRKVQSELNEFSDWATFAGKSASRFGTEVKEASASVSGMNTRLNTTTKRLSNWGVTTSQAAEGLKKVRDQMDAVIGRQQLISKPVRVRTSGYGEGGGNGGGGRHSGSYGHGGRGAENGVFSGLRGNIFLLGEIGDAARTVTDILFGWQKPIVEAASEMERMRVMLRGLNKDKANPGKAAAEDMQYIVDMAQNAPFAMQALTDSFVKFRSAGLDPTDGSLKALVDSVARFGGDSELLKRAAVAVQQMSGKGVVSMEELRQQLGEAVPNAMKAMADAAGITMGELTKAVSTGTVEAKQALSLMFVGLRAENENAAKDMMQTYTGALAQLQTSFTLFADRVGQAGYLDSLSKGMKELASIMNSAEGISFANSLGSGLTTAIDSLRELAQWLAKNQELIVNLGKVVAAMVAFKLMRAGIMGVIGTAGQMVNTFATMSTVIQAPFNLGATAVTRFNRAARMGLAPIPSLIFAIRGAITGLQGAFAGLTAFIAANPIGAAFTVATVAVAGLITYMTMLRSETSKVVDEIRKIPEAMTAAKRAQMAERAEKLEKEIIADQRALKTGESVSYVSNSVGAVTHKESKADIEARLKKNQEEYQKITGTIALGDGAVAKRLAKEAAESQIEKIRADNQVFSATFVKARQEALDKIQKINDDKSLSDDEKNKLLAPLRETVNKSYLEPAQKLVDSLSSRKNATEKQIAHYNDLLEKAKKEGNTEQIQKLQGSIRGYQEHLEAVAQELTQAEFERDNAAKTGKGVMSNQGTVLGLGTSDKAAQKALAQYMRNQMDSATYQRTLPDGTAMLDFEGKPIIGPKQLKTQLNLQKASSASSLEKMSDEERAAAIAALTKAREQDAAAAEKAGQRTANASQRAARKEENAQRKLAAGYQKALDKADQLMGQMGESSKATVSFDQSLRDTTKSLTELANAVPNEFITQEMIDKAKSRLADLANASDDYREMFNRRNVEQMISTWAPESDSIISAGYKPSREEKVADFNDTYNRNLKALMDLRDQASDPKIVALYTKQINQLVAAGNTALIKETGTATQKLALEYENLAEQLENSWSNLFSSLTDTLTDFVMKGKMDFSSLAESILRDITNMVVKTQITLPLMNMLGMGTTAAGSSQSGNLLSGVASAVANQGVRMNAVNGDKSVGEATKETSSSVSGLGQTTQQTTSAIGTATNAIGSWVSGLFSSTEAKDAETKAVKTSIFSMQNLSSVTGALSAAFAMLGANASGSGNKWLSFGSTVVSGLVSAWAGGGFDSLMSGSSGSSGFNNLTGSAADGTNGIPSIPKFAKGGIFGKDGVVPLRAYQKGGIADSPQLALFGEGDMNEAYVPLPDGRSIPVTLNAESVKGGGGGVFSPVSIEINVNSDGSVTENSNSEGAWSQAAQRMKAIALETIAQEKRPGGSLNPNSQRN
ncbi:phage tail tape measure protein [Salmonella enterica subsp. enterica serovar Mikawasima]|jgi:tape measure domain-containing protein|uniref:Tape measure protein n=2 Tax=Salmonella enterica TaxID=28901 RepID=A0A5J1FEW8_SALET|nr:phage tail tape measure protein [Salmonella enterica subsp. enterica serovar Braenderup]EAN4768044.1 phage tail tape measure protein [Salmonella enterica]EBS4044667.1 phage tail tape measure protein [Salmonella enterica subsp. enterica serovar Mikawasima]EBW1650352.1 phage tail tape measure protein [Salmonella enterica subsp. enterica serovar Mbandaka]HBI4188517.1 tape measure protein [Salmonella enterica subsp. enterica serovar Heidelberg]